MVAVGAERVPRVGVAENVTVSPVRGFPFRSTRAVIVDVMVEPAAMVVGFAETESVPEETVTETDFDMPPHEAVIIAVPVVDELKVTVAIPLEFVFTVEAPRFPNVVVKVTGTLTAKIPITSRTVTVIVDLIVEAAAIIVGAADITICGSLTSMASNGMVCP